MGTLIFLSVWQNASSVSLVHMWPWTPAQFKPPGCWFCSGGLKAGRYLTCLSDAGVEKHASEGVEHRGTEGSAVHHVDAPVIAHATSADVSQTQPKLWGQGVGVLSLIHI
eukprot:3938139-Rhodomonas_salina.1